jgi:hypothetical protein
MVLLWSRLLLLSALLRPWLPCRWLLLLLLLLLRVL